jgi:AraC family transcriptional regulator of adaptative response / DNA-3-methyladenine glycosylase II
VRAWPGIRIVGTWDPFECAVRAIVGEQTDLAAGPAILARIAGSAGTRLPVPTAGLTHAFPTARQISRADLSAVGLTSARAEAIAALAQAALSGSLDWNASTEDVIAALRAVPGIGSWPAQYVALRALGEPDAFPSADVVLRQVVGRSSTPLPTKALEARAEAWRPWRGYAAMLAWQAATAARRQRRARSAEAPSNEMKESQNVVPGLSRQHQSENRKGRR